jgi:thiamine-phosphate pyrophosphorylase
LSHPDRSDDMTVPRLLRGLYLLTPDETDSGRLRERVAAALLPGVALLQYRNKAADAGLRREQVKLLAPLAAQRGVPLIVNDDWRLAAELGAAGAHLGRDDGALAQARVALGPAAILGASCYGRLDLAERARDAGASYLAFGAMFVSTTKPHALPAPLSVLGAARALGLPTVAIGGLRPDSARQAIAAGADLLAVLGAVFDAADPAAQVRAFLSCFEPDPT